MRGGWSNREYRACDRFIRREIGMYGYALDKTVCLHEGWRALLEARHSYRKAAGCCSFSAYAAVCIRERMDLMRRSRNRRISLESRLSLDMCFDGSAESVDTRYFLRVGDCSAWIMLKDFIERQEKQSQRILWQMYRGMSDTEIMEENGMSARDYYRALEGLREAFREWQEIWGAEQIAVKLERFCRQTEERNGRGMLDLTRQGEDIVCRLLNLTFGWELVNLNRLRPNCPAVDLADDTRRICVQVTGAGAWEKPWRPGGFSAGITAVYTGGTWSSICWESRKNRRSLMKRGLGRSCWI